MHGEYLIPELFDTLRLLIVFGFIFGLIWLRKGRKGRSAQDDETRLAQEMHQTLERMERRVEALETLLMERERRNDR
jgi:phage shock protein B